MSTQDAIDSGGEAETPLVDLLRRVPADARLVIDDGPYSTQYIPVGRLCHEAAALLSPSRQREPEALRNLLAQVELFCEQYGEADFETAEARAALGMSQAQGRAV